MICSNCEELLDFASNPIGKIIRKDGINVRIYCKECWKKIARLEE